jgi:hypothetical protein
MYCAIVFDWVDWNGAIIRRIWPSEKPLTGFAVLLAGKSCGNGTHLVRLATFLRAQSVTPPGFCNFGINRE